MSTETIFDLVVCIFVVLGGTGYILYKNKQRKQEDDPNQRKIMRLDLIFDAIFCIFLIIGPITKIVIRICGGNTHLIGIIVGMYSSLTILFIILSTMIKRRYNSSHRKMSNRVWHITGYVFGFLLFALYFCVSIISLINLLQGNL